MTLYVCNVGTSAFQDVVRDPNFVGRHLPGSEPPLRLDAPLVRRLGVAAGLQALSPLSLEFDHRDDQQMPKKLSAEVHSFLCCEVSAADRVVLFYSDSDDGKLIARVVEDYLHHRVGLGENNVACRLGMGLQVNDATRFCREGVLNYFGFVPGGGRAQRLAACRPQPDRRLQGAGVLRQPILPLDDERAIVRN